MSRLKDMGLDVATFFNGRPAFLGAVLDTMGIPQGFEQAHAEHRQAGRLPDVPYGVVGKLFLINICDQHHPLYRMAEYFQDKDLQLLAGCPLELDQLHDDRFGDFLDQFAQWEPRKVFSNMASQVFMQYGLSIRSLNYDTTSKIMWGEYEDPEGKVGAISITLGHSKEKRGDKNQLKIGLGVADGAILDARVLSGNMDDKTYNHQTVDDVDALLTRHGVDRSKFYYVADSAFFTEPNLRRAKQAKVLFITRVPDNIKSVAPIIAEAWAKEDEAIQWRAQAQSRPAAGQGQEKTQPPLGFRDTTFRNAHDQDVLYRVQDATAPYRDETYQCAVCYSEALEERKRKTIQKQVVQEDETLGKLSKRYKKRTFACEADAVKEIADLQAKQLAKVLFHDIDITVQPEEKKRRGRPTKTTSERDQEYIYRLEWRIVLNSQAVERIIKHESTFILATNDHSLTAEQILAEYKTQSSVEKKFQQLKSPHFVNSLYLKCPQRIEALVYLILIAMMVLSVVERVVRREMQAAEEMVIGPGKIRQTRPSLRVILDIFAYLPVNRVVFEGVVSRELMNAINPSQQLIMDHLRLPPDAFTTTKAYTS